MTALDNLKQTMLWRRQVTSYYVRHPFNVSIYPVRGTTTRKSDIETIRQFVLTIVGHIRSFM